ncbi:MAG: 2Fe-2S iron-sulfur cluster-binding protein [Cyanobacteriota bacterium]|nr:2Fe-2S iron-sulfur cluster-binding protein [Cyanobacteriota bacterium]
MMNYKDCQVGFPKTSHPPLTLKENSQLSEHLTVQNSPVLFGCRTGICGSCLVLVEGDIPPAQPEERDILDIVAPGNKRARLACQIAIANDIEIIPLEENR